MVLGFALFGGIFRYDLWYGSNNDSPVDPMDIAKDELICKIVN